MKKKHPHRHHPPQHSPTDSLGIIVIIFHIWTKYQFHIDHMWKQPGCSLQWRHNGRGSVSNHQPHDCLLNRLFRRRSKKTPKLRVTGLCAGNSPGTGEFPAQMASYAENASIWWRHHVQYLLNLGAGLIKVLVYGFSKPSVLTLRKNSLRNCSPNPHFWALFLT